MLNPRGLLMCMRAGYTHGVMFNPADMEPLVNNEAMAVVWRIWKVRRVPAGVLCCDLWGCEVLCCTQVSVCVVRQCKARLREACARLRPLC